MKKLQRALSVFVMMLTACLTLPSMAQAAETTKSIGDNLSLLYCIPFAGILLCIAICPLVAGEWWEKRKPIVVAFWSLAFLIPFAIAAGMGTAWEELLEAIIGDYLTFIVLLFGLFCVAGNVSLEGDLVGKPKLNVLLLIISTLLSSWIGTTGASMLMIRPMIRANKWRRRKVQVMVFFIFLVSNIGGCLTPVGDPPLLMGFMRGVPFTWSLRLFPVLVFNMVILLTVFYFIDRRAYRRDIALGMRPDISKPTTTFKVNGLHNIIFMIMIVAGVVLSGVLPGMKAFQNADGSVISIPIFRSVRLAVPTLIEIVIILVAAFLSFKTTKSDVRTKNHFTWGAIEEVAVLFIGIFITMQPALMILKSKGAELGLTKPLEMFWATGALSSFLDNTPTYLVFLTTAGTLGATSGIATTVGTVAFKMLMAISCGAVFMGANTYIGNAPNFMVKSISDENGIKMPSFFGYMLCSLKFLIPVFIIDTLVFFL